MFACFEIGERELYVFNSQVARACNCLLHEDILSQYTYTSYTLIVSFEIMLYGLISVRILNSSILLSCLASASSHVILLYIVHVCLHDLAVPFPTIFTSRLTCALLVIIISLTSTVPIYMCILLCHCDVFPIYPHIM